MTICWLPYIVSHKLLSLHNFPHNYYFLNLIYSLYYLFWRTQLQNFETQHTIKTLSFNCHLPSLSLQSNLLSTMEAQKTWLLWSSLNCFFFFFKSNLTKNLATVLSLHQYGTHSLWISLYYASISMLLKSRYLFFFSFLVSF